MFEVKAYPEYSWSLSRHKLLLECNRKYAYNYYTSHNGWLREGSELAKSAYRLKNITNAEMFFGNIVHGLIEQVVTEYLKFGTVPEEQVLIDQISRRLNQGFVDSKSKRQEWEAKPKHFTMFHEIYYNGAIPEEKIEEIKYRLSVSMKNFLQSQTFRDIQDKTRTKVFEFEQFRTMTFHGTKTFIVMDMVYRDFQRGKWIIVDWKTGKSTDEDREQLALYALYLKQKFNLEDFTEIEVRNEYLLDGTNATYSLNEYDFLKVDHVFKLSNEKMFSFLEDTAKNQPVNLQEFEKTEHAWKCERCNYKELCEMY